MQKKILYSLLGVALVAILVGFFWWLAGISEKGSAPKEPSLFTSETCPHCKNVEDFIEKNKIGGKLTFANKEISNPNNLKEFYSVGKYCQIPTKELGFPLFWTGEKCLMGDQPIIDYLKEKTGIK